MDVKEILDECKQNYRRNGGLYKMWKKDGLIWAITKILRETSPLEFLESDWAALKKEGMDRSQVINIFLNIDYLKRNLEPLQFYTLESGCQLDESFYMAYRSLHAVRFFQASDCEDAFQLLIPLGERMNVEYGCIRPVYSTFVKKDGKYFYMGERFFEELDNSTKPALEKKQPLFKAKCLDTHEWIEGMPFYYHGGQTGIIQRRDETRIYSDLDGFSTIENLFCPKVDPNTVCEWTGLYDGTPWDELSFGEQQKFLLDHNKEEWQGKKIFEGDIVVYNNGSYSGKFLVEFETDMFTCLNFYCSSFDDPSAAFSEGTKDFRVVGSIYD